MTADHGRRRRPPCDLSYPGHAPDHLCFWHAVANTVLWGSRAEGHTVYIPPNLQGDLLDYLASLERVRALQPARLLPGARPGDRRS